MIEHPQTLIGQVEMDAEPERRAEPLASLRRSLARLDALIRAAVLQAQAVYGPDTSGDPFRGLHITGEDVEALLAREPGDPPEWASFSGSLAGSPPYLQGESTHLDWVRLRLGLAAFDMDVALLALAPEFDLRYERLFAFLQDDVSRRRPSVDLALNLLCPTAQARLERRVHFAPGSPLLANGVLSLVPDPHQQEATLLSHYLRLDDQVARLILRELDACGLDARIAPFCSLNEAASQASGTLPDDPPRDGLAALAAEWRAARRDGVERRLCLLFYGPDREGRWLAAEALAGYLGARLLVINIPDLLAAGEGIADNTRIALREAALRHAAVLLDSADCLWEAGRERDRGRLFDLLLAQPGPEVAIVSTNEMPTGAGVARLSMRPSSRPSALRMVRVPFPAPDYEASRSYWRASMQEARMLLGDDVPDALAARFTLNREQIAAAVEEASSQAEWRALSLGGRNICAVPVVSREDLFEAARRQTGRELGALACKIPPLYGWNDLVLPEDESAQLREMCSRAARSREVLTGLGFDRKLSLGRGVSALFAGPSGTGKTMAAEVIANELELDLYRIDLSGVVSKYIGETEKNLDRIFRAAEGASAILFFDEADALFGKRSEVRDSHDRYANIEISYLLQRMEQYDGLTILATNLRGNLDEAFTRRLAFTIYFPFPGEEARLRIWQGLWPERVTLGADVDLHAIARLKLSGGNIKNIALAAAFLAADGGGPITMAHLRHAARREYGKMGRIVSEEELGG